MSENISNDFSFENFEIKRVLMMKPICLNGHERPITKIIFNEDGDILFTAAKNPIVNVWYGANGEQLGSYEGHSGAVWCIDASYDTSHLVSASADSSLRVWDVGTGKCISTIKGTTPLRSCGFSYCGNLIFYASDSVMGKNCELMTLDIRDDKHVLLGGGQEAKDVTTTAVSTGKFDTRLYHMVYAIEFGRIKGHFGPVNSVQFTRDGSGFVSGGEDGYVRIHSFDPSYYELDAKVF